MILGSDFRTKSGIDMLSSTGTIERFENVLLTREAHMLTTSEYLAMSDAYIIQTAVEKEDLCEDWLEYAATEILDTKYEKADLNKVVKNHTQLNHEQRKDLREIFELHKTLFDGTLGVYPHNTCHIEGKKRAKKYRMYTWRHSKRVTTFSRTRRFRTPEYK